MKIKSIVLIVVLVLTAFGVLASSASADGNTLVAFDNKAVEVDCNGNVVNFHEFNSPVRDLERLSNGNTLVAFGNKAVEVDSAGNVVNSHTFSSPVRDLERVESTVPEEIPEFATIAIPAVAVLGLFLFYSHRKRKEE